MKVFVLLLSSFVFLSCSKSRVLKTISSKNLSANAIAIDVRSKPELNTNPAPGAIHIPLSRIEKALNLPFDTSAQILVFCESGKRASEAKKILETKGYRNVKNITDWRTWNKLQASH